MTKIYSLKMVVFNLLGVALFIGGHASAQTDSLPPTNKVDVDEIITSPDKMPEFMGDGAAMGDFLKKNIRYPVLAKENNISGKVYASFIVDVDGSISDIKIVHGIGGGCDEEVLRVLKLMPKWKPGETGGRPVKVKYMVPVSFTLK